MSFDWVALAAAIIALGGLVVAIIGTVIAAKSKRTSEEATKSAAESAAAAQASAKAAEELTRIEADRSHDLMAPTFEPPEFKWETSDRTKLDNLFCYLTSNSPRDYRVTGWSIQENRSRSQVAPLTLLAGREEKIHVGLDGMALPAELALAFDGPDCPCGGRRAEGEGHWVRTIAVEPPSRP